MYTSSLRMPLRKRLLMSSYWIGQPWAIVRIRTVLTVLGFTTSENVLVKSNPSIWWKPLATNLAIYLLTVPYAFSLTLNIHLHLKDCLWAGGGTKVHVLLLIRALYFACITADHSGITKACLLDVGSTWVSSRVGWSLGYTMSFFGIYYGSM